MTQGTSLWTLLAALSVCSTAHYVPPNFSWAYTSTVSVVKPNAATKTVGVVFTQVQNAYFASPLSASGAGSGAQPTGSLAIAAGVSNVASTIGASPSGTASAAGNSSPGGGTYTGDITWYDPVGNPTSCGQNHTEADLICALSIDMMANGPNPNANPKCGQTITLTDPANPGSWIATIADTCQGCAYEDVDLTPALFTQVAAQPTATGRVHNIQWKFN